MPDETKAREVGPLEETLAETVSRLADNLGKHLAKAGAGRLTRLEERMARLEADRTDRTHDEHERRLTRLEEHDHAAMLMDMDVIGANAQRVEQSIAKGETDVKAGGVFEGHEGGDGGADQRGTGNGETAEAVERSQPRAHEVGRGSDVASADGEPSHISHSNHAERGAVAPGDAQGGAPPEPEIIRLAKACGRWLNAEAGTDYQRDALKGLSAAYLSAAYEDWCQGRHISAEPAPTGGATTC